jgi:hypothetical protein
MTTPVLLLPHSRWMSAPPFNEQVASKWRYMARVAVMACHLDRYWRDRTQAAGRSCALRVVGGWLCVWQ